MVAVTIITAEAKAESNAKAGAPHLLIAENLLVSVIAFGRICTLDHSTIY